MEAEQLYRDALHRQNEELIRQRNSNEAAEQARRQVQREREEKAQREAEVRRKAAIRSEAARLRVRELQRVRSVRMRRLTNLERLSPREFEQAIADLYSRLGYTVELTPQSGDYGVDIIALKAKHTVVIECKRLDPQASIGRPVLQKLHSAMHIKSADGAIFVTTARFGKKAIEFAAQWNMELVDRKRLSQLLELAFGPADDDAFFLIMCSECGRTLRVPLMDRMLRAKCPCGHSELCDSTTPVVPEDSDRPQKRPRSSRQSTKRRKPRMD